MGKQSGDNIAGHHVWYNLSLKDPKENKKKKKEVKEREEHGADYAEVKGKVSKENL